ncbi:MAG: sigma-70 family RNA polymerase sigma factor [Polyangiaceae bacterium]
MTVRDAVTLPLGVDDSAGANVIHLPSAGQDALLVSALRAGQASGAAGLFDRYHGHVRRVLVRVLGADPELSDLVQDVFLSAIGSIERLDRAESLRGWLGSIAVFTARGRLRRRGRWRFLHFLPPDELPEVPCNSASPEVDEALRATYRVLNRLPVDERIVFALRFIDGMELTDVAEASDMSVSTVKRRLSKATTRFGALAQSEPSLVDWLKGDPRWSP